jgi:hypothetical protein
VTGEEMAVGLRILGSFGEVVTIAAEHDQVWLHSDRIPYIDTDNVEECGRDAQWIIDPSPLSNEQARALEAAGWFPDSEVGSWSHYC